MNAKITVHALWHIVAGLTEVVKELENLYTFNKDGFGFLVYLALLPKESPTVFVFWTCSTLQMSPWNRIFGSWFFFPTLTPLLWSRNLILDGSLHFLWRILLSL